MTADKEKIKAFVQDVLGCGCAEEVFKIIDLSREETTGMQYDRINIGNRLLVYVFRTDDPQFAINALPRMVRSGMDERNDKSFNRFRLVLATDDARVGDDAMRAYLKLGFTDNRTFMHVVKKDQVSF